MTQERDIYARRFADREYYRTKVWQILVREVFQPLIPINSDVLDLGCGYGEFINTVHAARRYAMDANADARNKLAPDVTFFEQDCAKDWPFSKESLDVVFSSNFFEHLENKRALHSTLIQANQTLRNGGLLIAMGPNIRYLPGAYWDFIDHHIPLTDRSLLEAAEVAGFSRQRVVERFLPYTMSAEGGRAAPLFLVSLYLRLPVVWRFFGKQFLLLLRKQR